MSPDNPLTARVRGQPVLGAVLRSRLVETQEDFGSQGQPPSHPELLDWLAGRASATAAGRSSRFASDRHLGDLSAVVAGHRRSPPAATAPTGSLARGPRFRLEAEMIRDSALAVAGLLHPKCTDRRSCRSNPRASGGARTTPMTWVTSAGDDRYRRGLYTFLKRTSPYPAMLTFDAPSREFCTVRRISTNTPLQASRHPQRLGLRRGRSSPGATGGPRDGGRVQPPRHGTGSPSALQLALVRPAERARSTPWRQLYRGRLDTTIAVDPDAARTLATDPLGPLPAGWDAAELAASHVCLQRDPQPRRVPDPRMTAEIPDLASNFSPR